MFRELFTLSNYYFNFHAFPPFLVGALNVTIGFFVFNQNRRSTINRAFFCACLSTGLWLLTLPLVYCSDNAYLASFWYRHFGFLGVVNIMPSLIAFGFAWLGEFNRKRALIITNYSIAFLFWILAITTYKVIDPLAIKYFWGYYPAYRQFAVVFIVFFLIQSTLCFKNIFVAYLRESNSARKEAYGLVALGIAIGFTAFGDFIPKFFNFPLYPYGFISIFAYIVTLAYAIGKYKLMDMHNTITRTSIFVTVYSIVLGLPFAVVTFRKVQLMVLLGDNWWMVPMGMLVALAAIGPSIYIYLHSRAETILMGEQRRYHKTLKQAAEELASIHSLGRLLKLIVAIVTKVAQIQYASIYVHDDTFETYSLRASRNLRAKPQGVVGEDNIVIQWLKEYKEPLFWGEIDGNIETDDRYDPEELRKQMESFKATLIIPGFLKNRLMGFLILGDKRGGKKYTMEDLNFFSLLGHEAALAIENAILYESMEELIQQRTDQLAQTQKQLIQAEKLATMGTLAGGVAHEINNPLVGVLNNAQMLLESEAITDDLDRECLGLIEEAARRCREIVQKLMSYARKPEDSDKLFKIDLENAVRKVVTFLRYQLEQENIKLAVNVDGDGYHIEGKENELQQVITNIILNAKDAIEKTKNSGKIDITLSKCNGLLELAITDTGPGMKEEVLAKIFDPFFTTKDVGKGLGLGLSICQSIIERHKGSVIVESKLGKGAKFVIRFPEIFINNKVEGSTV